MSITSRLRRTGKKALLFCALTAAQATLATETSAQPTPEQALALVPVQKDVDYARPAGDEIAKCTVKVEKTGNVSGWVIYDGGGQVIRRFSDTNGDNTVDQWSYFDGGLEVYRDADTNANGKADEFRWLSTGGSRWALDTNEDGKIDVWKSISAEEVSSEAVAAMAARDPVRFQRLLITSDEIQSLGLGDEQLKELGEKVAAAPKRFTGLLADKNVASVATGSARWLNFSGTKPYLIPTGTNGSTKDILVYENIVSMFEASDAADKSKPGQLQIGTMIKVGDAWRLIDMPELMKDDEQQIARGFFTDKARSIEPVGITPGGNGAEFPAELEAIEKQIATANSAQQLAELKKKKADLIENMLAGLEKPQDRELWVRQLIDTCSEGAQTGTYVDGLARLKQLETKLAAGPDKEFAPYARFSIITAEYMAAMSAPGAKFPEVQADWLKNLRKFVQDFPACEEAAEALSHLAIDAEFAGNEDEAKKLYAQIVAQFPKALTAEKASGALRRIESMGKPLVLGGTTVEGKTFQLNMLQGRIVVVHYWSSEGTTTAGDIAQLKALQAKYPREVAVVGVSLDNSPEALTAFLTQNRLPWTTLYEKGGMESRYAKEMGIFTVPTLLVVDAAGKVAVRNIDVTMLANEIAAMTKK